MALQAGVELKVPEGLVNPSDEDFSDFIMGFPGGVQVGG